MVVYVVPKNYGPNALMHHGIKGQKWGIRRTPEELGHVHSKPDIRIPRSLGAKFKNYSVVNKATGENFNFVEGTRVTNILAFAGKGCKKPLNDDTLYGLMESHPGSTDAWTHCKGIAYLNDHGEPRKAEIHWFEEKNAGIDDLKIKRWLED